MVVKVHHGPVLIIWLEDFRNLDNGTIQRVTIIVCCILSCYKTNTASISAIPIDGVSCKLTLHHDV
jgi:hypothetical protein